MEGQGKEGAIGGSFYELNKCLTNVLYIRNYFKYIFKKKNEARKVLTDQKNDKEIKGLVICMRLKIRRGGREEKRHLNV